jgi:hypothetical protein
MPEIQPTQEELEEKYQSALVHDAAMQQLLNTFSKQTDTSPAQIGRTATPIKQELLDYFANKGQEGQLTPEQLADQQFDRQKELIGLRGKEARKTQAKKEASKKSSKDSGTGEPKRTAAQSKAARTSVEGALAGSQYDEVIAGGYDPTSYTKILDNIDALPQFMKTDEGIAAQAGKKAWTEAFLREVSGAAIGLLERPRYMDTYFPVTGDSPKVVANKAALRRKKEDELFRAGLLSPDTIRDEHGIPEYELLSEERAGARKDEISSSGSVLDRIFGGSEDPVREKINTMTPEQKAQNLNYLKVGKV